MGSNFDSLSRVVSLALRHDPDQFGLTLNSQGWVAMNDLVAGIRAYSAEWSGLTTTDIEAMVGRASKRRHEISAGKIRALYGHSVPERVEHELAVPPEWLYHGTSAAAWNHIRVEGLEPMSRQFVHLSAESDAAALVGKRKSRDVRVLAVRARDAYEDGHSFFIGGAKVWLAERVPARFISIAPE